jgi:asparagine N-glycosylation enzyme membrane subunit Stt3
MWGVISGFAYFYMVSSWGGYVSHTVFAQDLV